VKKQSMFPYRRNGPKKRGKGGHNRRPRNDGGGRIPGSAAELLSALQPTTKALAQMLAGNTRQSGQLAHARHMLSQAQRLIDERQVERLPPAVREEFLEQLARLKLTLADADELGVSTEAGRSETRATPSLAPDRLREVALRLARSEPAPAPPPPRPPAEGLADLVEEPEPATAREEIPAGRGERIRLKTTQPDEALEAGRKPQRERLRLKPVSEGSAS
jgi:hypothetical protein